MSPSDWQSAGAYDRLRALDAPGFAWEFLTRNAEFLRDYNRLSRAAKSGKRDRGAEDCFALRWGVRFRRRGTARRPAGCTLDAARAAKRRDTDEPSP
ncbi:MAG TPA: DUF6499 domain-containing protein [Rhizomicrobium sp.]|jgi:hypothetical protein|nr:DUF6499 domain-containing protein [Rhizomicrobium sp.]